MRNIKNSIFSYLKNKPGFKTSRRIIVIESDDWGSIRMPSAETFEILKQKGIVKSKNRYTRFDTLANEKDLSNLFDVLHSIKDINGNAAKFTPISVLANPNYKKIKESRFKEYYYELFMEHLKREGQNEVLNLWQQGINGGFFKPQYHAREHLNVAKWLQALRNGHEATHIAFENEVYGITFSSGVSNQDSFLASYDFYDPSEIEQLKAITIDGLNQFEKTFGFRANYFVPPNGSLSSKLNETLYLNGVKGIQTARFEYTEPMGLGKTATKFRYLGLKTRHNQIYTLRNAIFEPDEPSNFDWKMKCLNDLEIAFKYKKPGIISSHRVNYIGALVPANRDKSLIELRELLKLIQNKWPDVEFFTSDELINLILTK
jgi:hypothetical protein